MNKTFSQPRSQHQELLKLFSATAGLLESYDSPPIDAGYWYGERALTGLLGAAAWSLRGGWSLEEFTGLRGNEGKSTNGRGDIWVGVGKKRFTIEAKAVWPGSSVENSIRGAEAKLSAAQDQLRQLHKTYRVGRPVAVCYIIPDLNLRGRFSDRQTIKDFFTQMPSMLSDRRTVVASLWYKQSPPRFNGRIYPGVILVARLLPGWS